MKIDLSIIIPVYEAKKTIQSAIESINHQKNLIDNFENFINPSCDFISSAASGAGSNSV